MKIYSGFLLDSTFFNQIWHQLKNFKISIINHWQNVSDGIKFLGYISKRWLFQKNTIAMRLLNFKASVFTTSDFIHEAFHKYKINSTNATNFWLTIAIDG